MSIKTEIEANAIELAGIVENAGADSVMLKKFAWAIRITNAMFWLMLLAIVAFLSPIVGLFFSPVVIFLLYTAFTGASAITRYSDL